MNREYFTVVPAVYLVFRRNGSILLLKRANTGYMDGQYSLPAGHVDGSEPARDAAVREAQEELGLTLNADDLRLVHTMHRSVNAEDKGGQHERIDLYFEATTWNGEPQNAEPHKCDELRWSSIAELPDDTVPEVRQALEKIAASETYSDYNFPT